MKHCFKTCAVALMLLLMLPCLLAACNSFSDTEYAILSEGNISADGFIYDKYENSTVRITGMENIPQNLIIPAEIDGMTVVEIGDYAFEENETIGYLELPNGNIKLGARVFSGCVSLVAANLSDSVSILPRGTFEGCRNLALVEGLGALTVLEDQAFAACSSLTYIKLPDTLTTIGAEAFRGCTSLPDIVIPDAVTFVGESAFWGCENLSRVSFGGSAAIPKYAFLDCTALAEVIIGDSVELIDEEAFRGCRALYSVRIGKKIQTIHAYAFHACDSLIEIVFAGNANSINVAEGNESLGLSKKGG